MQQRDMAALALDEPLLGIVAPVENVSALIHGEDDGRVPVVGFALPVELRREHDVTDRQPVPQRARDGRQSGFDLIGNHPVIGRRRCWNDILYRAFTCRVKQTGFYATHALCTGSDAPQYVEKRADYGFLSAGS